MVDMSRKRKEEDSKLQTLIVIKISTKGMYTVGRVLFFGVFSFEQADFVEGSSHDMTDIINAVISRREIGIETCSGHLTPVMR